MAAEPLTADVIRDANTRYHDVAAAHYDAKWGIDFGEIGQTQVVGKLAKALGGRVGSFGRSLEIGAGTGYFSLNLVQAGIVREAVATDISPGMLDTLRANAQRLGLDVETVACDAEALPFADDSFDLVFGHAVLHHLPHLDVAFSEFLRVLRPGGTFVFAGEPSLVGDRLAGVPKRGAAALSPVWRALLGARPSRDPGGHGDADPELERIVDVHAFVPDELARHARGAGFEEIRVRGEELLANWFGWANRTLESTAEPGDVPMAWRQYAYHGYLFFQSVDRRLLEPRLPARIFYNLMVTGRRPA
ncbi:class I SAM-dependent methyltransferase [Capillimicrobium parvum]|uniref:2-methoxy-6-polyprenyl-1,4-benzoquinol methylase, mitochondrial n=1 Tax=Capillimicrobium parvum TaxID=2884022 RepID=A0A9E7C002_9ACTN|nr:class I SAM-dependent methyltransferase [Capillimicrobium parvum]UGS35022.1 2-methoxy-6-polyprenyl-1,4-benzoquinol methylase, mitochondrial [Capillimicrobium parvum]